MMLEGGMWATRRTDCGECFKKTEYISISSCLTTRSDMFKYTCSVRCVTCASSSFSPFAGVGAATGIFLADEGLDVGVEDLGVVELDLDAPAANLKSILFSLFYS